MNLGIPASGLRPARQQTGCVNQVITPLRFGRNDHSDAFNPSLNCLLDEIRTGKLSGLKALQTVDKHYPHLTYHGSPTDGIQTLEPRQAKWHALGNWVQDGQPSVTSYPDFRAALFRALSKNTISNAIYTDNKDGSLTCKAYLTSREWTKFKQDKTLAGFVYVLNPDGMVAHHKLPEGQFRHFSTPDQRSPELRSEKSVTPLASVRVTLQDLLVLAQKDTTFKLLDKDGKPLDLS